MGRTVKPRTNLLLDIGLFSLVLVHLISALTINVILHSEGPTYLSWHRVLGFTGISLALVVAVHLLFHLSWVKVQFRKLVHPGSKQAPSSSGKTAKNNGSPAASNQSPVKPRQKRKRIFSHNVKTDYIHLNLDLCEACWGCVEACPSDVLGKVDFGFHRHVRIDAAEQCTGCAQCVRACPHEAITQTTIKERVPLKKADR